MSQNRYQDDLKFQNNILNTSSNYEDVANQFQQNYESRQQQESIYSKQLNNFQNNSLNKHHSRNLTGPQNYQDDERSVQQNQSNLNLQEEEEQEEEREEEQQIKTQNSSSHIPTVTSKINFETQQEQLKKYFEKKREENEKAQKLLTQIQQQSRRLKNLSTSSYNTPSNIEYDICQKQSDVQVEDFEMQTNLIQLKSAQMQTSPEKSNIPKNEQKNQKSESPLVIESPKAGNLRNQMAKGAQTERSNRYRSNSDKRSTSFQPFSFDKRKTLKLETQDYSRGSDYYPDRRHSINTRITPDLRKEPVWTSVEEYFGGNK